MREAGFSLIELALVVVVMGVVALVATPSVLSGKRSAAQRAVVNEFMAGHALARATAVRYGRVAEFHVDPAGKRYWIAVDTSAVGGVLDTIGPVRVIEHPSMTMSSNRMLLCFDARGLATTAGDCEEGNATVTFAFPDYTKTLEMTLLGKVLP